MVGKPVELSRKVKREIEALRESDATGEVTIAGVRHLAYRGTLVTPECYAALVEAGPDSV